MDLEKCRILKQRFGPAEWGQLIPISEFFDGNDDLGSIGCNLIEHPGVERFRDIFLGLLERPDVQAIYAHISELDPGEDAWPFADVVRVAGTIPIDALRDAVVPLQPDEVGESAEFAGSATIAERHGVPVHFIWWD